MEMTNAFRTVNINNLRSSDTKNSILNDVPPSARSCIAYEWNYLNPRLGGGDSQLPNDVADPNLTSAKHRRLESLQAVMKSILDSSSIVFSHMLLSPEDVEVTLGKDFQLELIRLRDQVSTSSISC